MAVTWFEKLFGFAETSYDDTRAQLTVEGETLRSHANGRTFGVGRFSTPTLATLRAAAPKVRGTLRVRHEVIDDVLTLHAQPDNRGAVFQVASQFNCLEFADPREVPEDGVTMYADDPTQGPACALAAAAATVYRNYFAPVDGAVGQTRARQLDNLGALAGALGRPGEFFDVRSGYTWSDEARLARLAAVVEARDREALLGTVRIGLQRDVEVTFAERFVEPASKTSVTQAFCSAISCGYTRVGLEHWTPLATLALDAAYEATLLAAAAEGAAAGEGAPQRVWLTMLGGGAFGNRPDWIARAIGRALRLAADRPLDVRIAHYRRLDAAMRDRIEAAREGDDPT